MAPNFDLHLLPIARVGGQDQMGLPGVHIASPKRRVARGRANDHLILYLDLQENNTIDQEHQSKILQKLTHAYYSTPGSISSTLRIIVEDLNDILFELNQKGVSGVQRTIGLLTQIVVRPDSIYLAQSGPVHAYIITAAGCEHLYDPALTGQGLGLRQATQIRFFQAQIKPADFLLLASCTSPTWELDLLSGLHGQGPESIRRRLLDNSTPELNAVLVHASQGQGRIHYSPIPVKVLEFETVKKAGDIDTEVTKSQQVEEKEPVQAIGNTENIEVTESQDAETETEKTQQEDQVLSETSSKTNIEGDPKPQTQITAIPVGTSPSPVERTGVSDGVPEQHNQKGNNPSRTASLAALVTLGEAVSHFFQFFGRGFGKFFGRLFPEELLEISGPAMAVIAIMVPLVIVAAASLVYYQLGRADQGRRYYLKAGETALHALELQQPLSKRAELLASLDFLNQADEYGGVPPAQINELQSRLYSEIDKLDIIRRIDYKPALESNLSDGVQITRLLVSFDDLYMLDSSTGSVLRAFKTPVGYQVDGEFRCSPEFTNPAIKPLVDMILWQGFDPAANIMAIDSVGNILFCHPGKDPIKRSLSQPSTGGFQRVTAVTTDRGNLYVLDAPANAVWLFPFGQLDEAPDFFFGETPPSIQDVVDLAANFDELYLLHLDGHLTLCFAFAQDLSLPKCNDPQPYTDFREGRENTPYIPSRSFSQIYANPSPDPSLYFLEPKSQSVTHFSLRNLGFLQEFSPLTPLPGGDATGFTVSGVERLLFLSLGNRVFFGVMP